MVVIKCLKSSGDDLLLQTSFSDYGDHIFLKEKRRERERRHLGLTKTEGIRKRFDYIPILKSGTAEAGSENTLGFFIF